MENIDFDVGIEPEIYYASIWSIFKLPFYAQRLQRV